MSDSSNPTGSAVSFRGHTCRDLYKAIFDADSPEQMVRQLPAQSLFMVMKNNGLGSSLDLMQMATLEQCRLISDFDLWHRDSLNEEALWEWLSLTDETDSLAVLQKIVKFIDLKLLALLIGKYTEVQTFDEGNDQPPGPGFHTPDKGHTWVGIKVENPDHHFLLARVLALIFESSPELYYQLLQTPSVATVSMLEEESYIERTKRLANEGVPEPEAAAQLHAPYSIAEATKDLSTSDKRLIIEDIRGIEPLVYESRATRYVSELFRTVSDHESLEMEFTFLLNASVVRFGVDFCEQDAVLQLCEKVKGAINIGLERLLSKESASVREIYDSLGLTKLFRLGLTQLMSLRTTARKLTPQEIEAVRDDPVLFSTIAGAREAFPEMPMFLQNDGGIDGIAGSLSSGHRSIDTQQAIDTIRTLIAKAAVTP